jgi:hypothetical protein
LDDAEGDESEMKRRTAGQIRQDRENYHLNPGSRLQVVEKWECHFRNDIRRNGKLRTFCDARKPPTPQRSVTENDILEGVASGRLFGMVECDIRVPDEWPSYFQHPTMTPYEYFEEMSPLFCTTDVPFELIGEHM